MCCHLVFHNSVQLTFLSHLVLNKVGSFLPSAVFLLWHQNGSQPCSILSEHSHQLSMTLPLPQHSLFCHPVFSSPSLDPCFVYFQISYTLFCNSSLVLVTLTSSTKDLQLQFILMFAMLLRLFDNLINPLRQLLTFLYKDFNCNNWYCIYQKWAETSRENPMLVQPDFKHPWQARVVYRFQPTI